VHLAFSQLNADEAWTFVSPKMVAIWQPERQSKSALFVVIFAMKGSQTTHPSSLHNAQVLPVPARHQESTIGTSVLHARVNGGGPTHIRSTGTNEIAAATRIGARIIESHWMDAGRGAEELKLRNDNDTIGELIERYRERDSEQHEERLRGRVKVEFVRAHLLNA
jgi:hypothetical protein